MAEDVNKLEVFKNAMIVGAAGDFGMIQKCSEILEKYADKIEQQGLTPKIRTDIANEVAQMTRGELARFEASTPHGAHQHFMGAALIIAVKTPEGKKRLWVLSSDSQNVFMEHAGKVAVGSGDVFAYTLLKNHDVKNMELEKAILYAYGTVREVIGLGAFGVGGHVDICTMDNNGNIKRLSAGEIDKYHAAYAYMKKKEKDFEETIWPDLKQHINPSAARSMAGMEGATETVPMKSGMLLASLMRSEQKKAVDHRKMKLAE